MRLSLLRFLCRCALLVPLAGFAGGASGAEPSAGAYQGMQAGFTAEGLPFLGASSAPVTMEEWTDYVCPFCGLFAEETLPKLRNAYVRQGRVRIVLRDLPLEKLHPTAMSAHVAAGCAGRQGAEKYWAMHDALFARQAEWSELSDPAAFLESLAVALGVDAASYRACLANGDAAAAVRRSLADAQALGYSGTPNFRFIAAAGAMAAVEGAQPLTRFTEVIDALLAGKEPPAEPAPERAPLPLWATPRGLAPDPARPGYDVAGDAYKGSPQAKVFVVEFTDFQCPACRKHATEVQPALDAEWVKSGRVLWVSKHLPLRMHAQAVLAAVAAECAGEQGRYWEMHDRLFAHQDDWSGASAETSLPGLARQLGLDPQRFQQCFDGRKALERVLADLYDAQGIVDRVPTFVVLTGGPTGTATGPLPAEGFGKLLQQAQSEAQAAAAAAKAPPDPKH